jgi:hypothetical protein
MIVTTLPDPAQGDRRMAIMGVPFKAPAPFPLPEDFASHLRSQAPADAMRMICQLLVDNQCGDLIFLEALGADGNLKVAAAAGADALAQQTADALVTQADALAYALPAETGPDASMSAIVMQAKAAQLVMGELTPDDTKLPQAPLRQFLLGGQEKANIGFSYYNPIVDDAGAARGCLAIFRYLPSGPLNHDQPALVAALVGILGQAMGAAPVG